MKVFSQALSLALFLRSALAADSALLKGSMNKLAISDADPVEQSKGKSDELTLTLVNNHAYNHYGLFFVMVHDESVGPLYAPNEEASPGLGLQCNTGAPNGLVGEFSGVDGVSFMIPGAGILFAETFSGIDFSAYPFPANAGSLDIVIPAPERNEVITVVGMIANSNDGCVILNGVHMESGDVATMIEIDAGTEGNDETCETIGGCFNTLDPAPSIPDGILGGGQCPCGLEIASGPQPAGEGFMSLHAGLGLRNGGLLKEDDWRGNMVTVYAN